MGAVPAVVQPVEIPREGALGQIQRVVDVSVTIAEHDVRGAAHRDGRHIPLGVRGVGGIERHGVGHGGGDVVVVRRSAVLDAYVVEAVDRRHAGDIAVRIRRRGGLEHVDVVALAEHRGERVALLVRPLRAEHIAAASEPDVDELLGQSRVRLPADVDRVALAAVRNFVDAVEGLIAGDIDGDRRHDEVQGIAVDIAREPGFSRLGGAEIQRGSVPDDGNVVSACGINQLHICACGQEFEQEVRRQVLVGRGDVGGPAVAVAHLEFRLARCGVGHHDLKLIDIVGGAADAVRLQSAAIDIASFKEFKKPLTRINQIVCSGRHVQRID